MQFPFSPPTGTITETIRGIVDRVTYHNPDNGWSVLGYFPSTVPVSRRRSLSIKRRFLPGRRWSFREPGPPTLSSAVNSRPQRPLRKNRLQPPHWKIFGIRPHKGVGPKTAKKIVTHFGEKALEIFEGEIERLTEIPGIAEKKLEMISLAWAEHRAIRDVMMFLQSMESVPCSLCGFSKNMATTRSLM